tara:strand:- start:5469 stop:6320 length:852 start_codon:yes stop_codon:yes gene_type:complete
MKFSKIHSDLFIPDSLSNSEALSRTTHLGVGAHQDDLEFMALHGILECFQQADQWFSGVTCTDGAGSSRTGPYATVSDEEMKGVRMSEQRTAAVVGQYGFMAQLGFPSAEVKDSSKRSSLVDELEQILRASRPQFVYTHNPFDKHSTHIGVFLALREAILRLPEDNRPERLIGCEVWRCLDWIPDSLKVVQGLDRHPNLAAALNGVFDSQITGGKRYDLAVEGRRLANATFFDSHSTDQSTRVAYAVDLTQLILDESLTVEAFAAEMLESFRKEVGDLLASLS